MNCVKRAVAILGAAAICAGCAGTDSTDSDPATDQSIEQDLTSRHCGTYLHGACPTGYECHYAKPGMVGGTGHCVRHKD